MREETQKFVYICRLKKWGMDSYLYAPKDDYKHRAYWRDLYTVEEAEHLTGLITAARECGIMFYYALSPGLDITYSSAKEVAALKRKLEQVSQFGCTAFALLFDDIEPEMSEADKEMFQSFAHAQVFTSILESFYNSIIRFFVLFIRFYTYRYLSPMTFFNTSDNLVFFYVRHNIAQLEQYPMCPLPST